MADANSYGEKVTVGGTTYYYETTNSGSFAFR